MVLDLLKGDPNSLRITRVEHKGKCGMYSLKGVRLISHCRSFQWRTHVLVKIDSREVFPLKYSLWSKFYFIAAKTEFTIISPDPID